MLSVLTYGLPDSAMGILSDAISKAFDNTAKVHNLSDDMLRQRIRLSMRDLEVVLVVLNKDASERCRDIEGGLYSSDKYFGYTNDNDLVDFLNAKYNLSLEFKGVIPIDDSRIRELEEMIESRNRIIENRNSRIEELEAELDGAISFKEYSELQSKVSELEEKLHQTDSSTLDSDQVQVYSSEIKSLTERLESLTSEKDMYEEKCQLLESDVVSLNSKISDLNTDIDGLNCKLREKESDIAVLYIEKQLITELENQVSVYKKSSAEYSESLTSLRTRVSELQEVIDSLTSYKEMFDKESTKVDMYEEKLSGYSKLEDDYKKLSEKYDDLVHNKVLLSERIEEVTDKYKASESQCQLLSSELEGYKKDIVTLNQDSLQLKERIAVLERSTDRNTNMEDLLVEIGNLRQKLASSHMSVYGKIDSLVTLNGGTGIHLVDQGTSYSNISFVFSGSAESRRDTYRCLKSIFTANKSIKTLLIDCVSETALDYVFEIKNLIPGTEWFMGAGKLENYLSTTCLDNVKALSMGLKFINDGMFLKFDWGSLLSSLEHSEYRVYIYFGDLSNIVGRIMHESFASLGESFVFVKGNATGSRSLIQNFQGISNSNKSRIVLYNFNEKLRKLYSIISKNNTVSVLNI